MIFYLSEENIFMLSIHRVPVCWLVSAYQCTTEFLGETERCGDYASGKSIWCFAFFHVFTCIRRLSAVPPTVFKAHNKRWECTSCSLFKFSASLNMTRVNRVSGQTVASVSYAWFFGRGELCSGDNVPDSVRSIRWSFFSCIYCRHLT